MAQVVVDASALTEVLVGNQPHVELRRRVLLSHIASPEVLDLEVCNAVRRSLRRRTIDQQQADQAMAWLGTAPIARSPHRVLIHRVWELRHSIIAYDASYVALAEALDVPLVTCDAKLAGSNGHHAKIEMYSAG